jgi:deoxyribodipyrimidine photo-lyase
VTAAAVALFTRDLRVRDNPVLTAAHREAATVVPLFVLDEAIVSGRSCPPNRAHFLAAALRELDDELRALGGRLVIRAGDVAEEVARVAEAADAPVVHIAADVSAYSRLRERRLRDRLARDGRELRVHTASLTVVPPGDLVPAGNDHFAVFTPYLRRWTSARHRAPLRAPRHLELPEIAAGSLPEPGELGAGEPSPELSVGGETTGRKILRDWLSRSLDGYASGGDDLAADTTSRLSPTCISVASRRGRWFAAPVIPPRAPPRSSGRWPGGTSTTRSWPPGPARHGPTIARGISAGAKTSRRSRPGARDTPVSRSWTPGCGNCAHRAGCTIAPA